MTFNNKKLILKKAHNQLQDMYEPIAKIISDKKEKEIILTLIQDLSDKLLDYLDYDIKEKYEHLAEQLVGDDATDRYTHEELIAEVNRLKDIEEREYE